MIEWLETLLKENGAIMTDKEIRLLAMEAGFSGMYRLWWDVRISDILGRFEEEGHRMASRCHEVGT